MKNTAKDLIKRIASLRNDVYDYISETEHWLFYWISNKEVQDFIKEYPEDFEDMVHISIMSVDSPARVKIIFDDHPYDIDEIERYATLTTFRDIAKAHWLQWNGNIKKMQIEDKMKELSSYKKRIGELEHEIEELKKEK